MKAHDINGTKTVATKTGEDLEATPTPQSTPKKRKTPRKAAASPKKKVKAAMKGEASDEEDKAKAKAKLVKKEGKEDDSGLSGTFQTPVDFLQPDLVLTIWAP